MSEAQYTSRTARTISAVGIMWLAVGSMVLMFAVFAAVITPEFWVRLKAQPIDEMMALWISVVAVVMPGGVAVWVGERIESHAKARAGLSEADKGAS